MGTGSGVQAFTKPNDLVRTHMNEAIKQFLVYDGSNRMVTTYVAATNAVDGDTCLRTDYTYVGASVRIEKMKESLDVWQSIWDI